MSFLNLKNFLNSIRKDKYLLAALLIGLLLRGLNPTFGSPSLYVSNDEAIAHLSALNMIAQKTPVSIANYTPLGAYIQIPFLVTSFIVMKFAGFVDGISAFEIFILTHEGYFLFIPRLMSALFGTLIILVVYKITIELYKNKHIGLLGAFLCAASFNLVHISHFGRPWTAVLFFFLLSVYFALKKRGVHSLLTMTTSYGFHQVGLFALPFIFFKLNWKKLNHFLAFIASFLIIFIFSLLTLRKGIIESIGENQSFLLKGKFAADLLIGSNDLIASFFRTLYENLSIYYIVNFVVTDGVIFLFGFVGLGLYYFQRRKHEELVFFIVGYFIFASLFFHPLIRYLLPVFLLLIPFAAGSIFYFFHNKKVLIYMIIFIASINSIWWNYLFLQKPTFIQADNWISQNIPVETPIYFLGGRLMTFTPNKQAIQIAQVENAAFMARLDKILPNNYSDNVRSIIYVNQFPGRNKFEQLKNASSGSKNGYVVDYYISFQDRLYFSYPDQFILKNHFFPTKKDFFQKKRLPDALFDSSSNFSTIDNFTQGSMYDLERMGPYFDILIFKN